MKLIALDLDGTTLNSKRVISEENIRAIKEAQHQGHIVMIMSGRVRESILGELSKYDLVCPYGANNGTELFVNDEIINRTSLHLSQCQKIALEIEQEYAPYKIITDKGTFAPSDWGERIEKAENSGCVPDINLQHRDYNMFTLHPKERGYSLFDHHHEIVNDTVSIQKMLVLTLIPEQKDRLYKKLESIDEISITSSTPFNLELTHLNGSKGHGLINMAQHFGIPKEDTIAIGDERNDISMLKAAGLSFAMGNAEEEVKKHSDKVTLTNDENGVAYVIENYVLK
ncbi:Cof-type HAD-IIB family hydrolase [Neobacillus sp. Marseille-QA0830]